ncbi:unnamed protein product [Arabidopsis thaliana]|uniref:(thale cress) hypothetical protein n=1 Tax=Arabidopsis thaliana TaxID=3702 RepID=A0A7G2E4G1_ARATH|nr:unnamed protein product [Arabidopsis thaliana]
MSTSIGDNETGAIVSNENVEFSVDFRGNPSIRSSSGAWKSSGFTMSPEEKEDRAKNMITLLLELAVFLWLQLETGDKLLLILVFFCLTKAPRNSDSWTER